MVRPAAVMGRAEDTHRHAGDDAEDRGQRRQLDGGRGEMQDVVKDRAGRDDGCAEVALKHMRQIDPELDVERLVQREFLAHPRIDGGKGPVADDGQNRVDRHHPADQEGDREQAEEGQQDRAQEVDRSSRPTSLLGAFVYGGPQAGRVKGCHTPHSRACAGRRPVDPRSTAHDFVTRR